MGHWHEVRMSPLWSDFGAERDPALYTNTIIDTNTDRKRIDFWADKGGQREDTPPVIL